MAKISYHKFFFISRFHHDSLSFGGFTILSEHCSQNNFPIIKAKPFKVTKYKKRIVDI